MKNESFEKFLAQLGAKNSGHQPEYLQACTEIMESIWPFIEKNPQYQEQGLIERLLMPERIIIFRVVWTDDQGKAHINKGYRIQHSSSLGPYKGGMRFHPTVNLSIMKFLALEQTLKNALTTLPMGGGKGGSDFDPKGKSTAEIMRFCQSFMSEMYRHLGADTDVPAGDIGVGGREIGFMAGMMKKLSNKADCVFTGKGVNSGGSLIRPESTGYGLVYFTQEMLKNKGHDLEGLRVSVSGSGNVAQYAIEKALSLGAKVVTASDSAGTVYDPEGFTQEKLAILMDIKNKQYERVSKYAKQVGAEYHEGTKPWQFKVDVALPCATQNELNEKDADTLIKNGTVCVAEGANMPTNINATKKFEQSGVLFAPGKASNAGGVSTSGFEMSQNAMRIFWTREEVEAKLHKTMRDIHESCLLNGYNPDGSFSYQTGANVSSFTRVANAMIAQGLI